MRRNSLIVAAAFTSGALLLAEQSFAGPLDELLGAALKAAAQDMKEGKQQKVEVQPTTAAGDSKQTQSTASPVVKYDEATIEKGWSCFPKFSNYNDGLRFRGDEKVAEQLLQFLGCKKTPWEETDEMQQMRRAFLNKYFRFDLFVAHWQSTGFGDAVLKNATFDAVSDYQSKVRGARDYSMKLRTDSSAYDHELSARKEREREQKEQKNMEEQQKTATLDADLRAGKVKPANLYQAAIAFGAENGTGLASAPKIRPDGKLYAMHGAIEKAGSGPEFLARSSRGQSDEALLAAMRNNSASTNYFKVKIPKAMQANYFDNAKVDGGFDLIGRYVENISYKTVAGQQKSAPVFEAVYFVIWK